MQIETWPIERPKPYAKNARKWGEKAVQKVADSIREYGWRQPIVVDAEGVIVIGHLRLTAAKHLKLAEVPVHVASDLTPVQIRGLRLADNRVHEEADWDQDLLVSEMLDLSTLGIDLSMTAFETFEIDKLLKQPDEEDAEANACPDLPVAPVSELGDLWLLGRSLGTMRRLHRRECRVAPVVASVGVFKADADGNGPAVWRGI